MDNLLISYGIKAKQSAKVLSGALSSDKDNALDKIANMLEEKFEEIIKANELDLREATKNGLSSAMQDRLRLDTKRISDIAQSVREVAMLPDPIGVVLDGATRPNGLEIIKKSVPLGVVGIIYESRPNVTIDSAVLCLKSGNACILRGGSEAINSNIVLTNIVRDAISDCGIPKDSVQIVENTSREYANALMTLNGYVDVLIPRGGKGLIKAVVENATVPVIETGAGMCHLYVDEHADTEMALNILVNAKTSRPSVCNAVETLLIHEKAADEFLPLAAAKLQNVELRACDNALAILSDLAIKATEQDWNTEHDDYILNIRVVPNMQSALDHIEKHSTRHSETIITQNYDNAQHFLNAVDATAVYVNASSRFTDGGEFGLGAEIGISTQKLHVRGPMGLMALTSSKYIIRGNGQVR